MIAVSSESLVVKRRFSPCRRVAMCPCGRVSQRNVFRPCSHIYDIDHVYEGGTSITRASTANTFRCARWRVSGARCLRESVRLAQWRCVSVWVWSCCIGLSLLVRQCSCAPFANAHIPCNTGAQPCRRMTGHKCMEGYLRTNGALTGR